MRAVESERDAVRIAKVGPERKREAPGRYRGLGFVMCGSRRSLARACRSRQCRGLGPPGRRGFRRGELRFRYGAASGSATAIRWKGLANRWRRGACGIRHPQAAAGLRGKRRPHFRPVPRLAARIADRHVFALTGERGDRRDAHQRNAEGELEAHSGRNGDPHPRVRAWPEADGDLRNPGHAGQRRLEQGKEQGTVPALGDEALPRKAGWRRRARRRRRAGWRFRWRA